MTQITETIAQLQTEKVQLDQELEQSVHRLFGDAYKALSVDARAKLQQHELALRVESMALDRVLGAFNELQAARAKSAEVGGTA